MKVLVILLLSLPVYGVTADQFVGTGSVTNAVDLGTAEVAGTLAASSVGAGLTNFQVNNDLTINYGNVDNSPVGFYSPSTGKFTTLQCAGLLTTPASTAVGAGLTISPGVDPDTPNAGNVWMKSDGLFICPDGITTMQVLTSASSLILEDSVNLRFGTDADFQWRFDGTNLQLRDGAGNEMGTWSDAGTTGSLGITGILTAPSTSNAITIGSSCTMSSPPAIGGVAPAAGAFTTLGATGVLTASNASNAIRIGTSCDLTTPPAIGGVTPAAVKGTNLTATGSVYIPGYRWYNNGTYSTQSNGTNTISIMGWNGTAALHGIGVATPESQLHVVNELTGVQGGGVRGIALGQHITGTAAAVMKTYRSRGTYASPTTLVSGDESLAFTSYNHDGTSYVANAGWGSIISGAVSTGVVPSAFVFGVNSAGIANLTSHEIFRIDENGTRNKDLKCQWYGNDSDYAIGFDGANLRFGNTSANTLIASLGPTGSLVLQGNISAANLGSISSQSASAIAVTGGTINGTVIGGVTPAAGAFTTIAGTDATLTGDLAVNGGDVTSSAATVNLFAVTPTTVNLGLNAAVNVGKTALFTTVKGKLNVDEAATFDSTVEITGTLVVTGGMERTYLTQQDEQIYAVPFTSCRVWNNLSSPLPAAAALDDLGLITGTWGTADAVVQTIDAKVAGTVAYLRFQYPLPVEYVDGETVTLRLAAGMVTTWADTSANIDVEVREVGTPGSDICATSPIDINTDLVIDDCDFTITPDGLVPGDVLDIRVKIVIVDGVTGTAVIGEIDSIKLLLDVKG